MMAINNNQQTGKGKGSGKGTGKAPLPQPTTTLSGSNTILGPSPPLTEILHDGEDERNNIIDENSNTDLSTVMADNLPKVLNKDDVLAIFTCFGPVASIEFLNNNSSENKGGSGGVFNSACVKFHLIESAERALTELKNYKTCDDVPLIGVENLY
jgi:hypothetical protein